MGMGVIDGNGYRLLREVKRKRLLRRWWRLVVVGVHGREGSRGIVVFGSFGFARNVRVPLFEDFLLGVACRRVKKKLF